MPKSTSFQDAKQADWLMLCQLAIDGLICLKYLDESGFEKTSPLNYTSSKLGQQKSIYQPRRRGRRISVLGFWEPQHSFEYGVVVGGFNSERYLQLLQWQAHLAQQRLEQTCKITVIIQDGASFHRSKKVQQYWQSWQQQGLYIFFLPLILASNEPY
ncbi:MAG: transposase [Nostoc sp. DedSLP03]|uniref:transposase n=1 Tax=Nostoc sp. DedSLP03 TaxID=3075400 RepID=UPI002AD20F32|nr:transposase [Nostoc sp. DedSLP03]MDZ7969784.1 transposase [Nostoc sp. DedSLP03]